MSNFITETEIEQIALDILNEDLGYTMLYGFEFTIEIIFNTFVLCRI